MVHASTVGGAAKWLASTLIEEGKYLYGVKDHVRDLQKELECMEEILQKVDANPAIVKEDGQLRILTNDIRELAFRAEDAIDTYIVDVGEKVYRRTFFLKLVWLVSHSYPLHMLRNEIEAVQRGIQDARKRFQRFGMLVPNTTGFVQYGSSSKCPSLAENFVHLDDEVVLGIDEVVTNLVNRLTNADEDFKVLGIVGTGGAGKSTLATQLFRHNRVISMFPHRAFVSISQQWSRIDLLQRIFKKIMGDQETVPSIESELMKRLHDFMKDRNCLVILDDIWKKEAWVDIYPVFPRANKASCRVIMTTRIEEIPLYADSKCIIHEPQLLNEAQKWALFSKVAMEGRPHIERSVDQYEKLGRQMLGKCSGLPLAVITLAGVLRTKRELYEWEVVSKACSENILKERGAPNYGVVEDMLELSYLDLPTYLKPCFLYLAIFPEDYNIEACELVRMWIAEGFVTKDLLGKGQRTFEEVGMQFLNELAHRCIIQVRSRNVLGQVERFYLHDLMRDLCVKKAEEHQFVDMISFGSTNGIAPNRARRIGVSSELKFPMDSSLRTFVDFDKSHDFEYKDMSENMEQLRHCKLLRVLIMRSLSNNVQCNCIGKLVHLRLLVFTKVFFYEIPKSVKDLRNLLHLEWSIDTHGCSIKVPNDLVCNMENLRTLLLPLALFLECENYDFSLGLRGCKKLQCLESGAGRWMKKDLPTLISTVQSLAIIGIHEMEEIEAIYLCPSIKEGNLCSLKLWVNYPIRKFDLQKLRHCKTLWNLELTKFSLVFGELGAPLEFPSNLVKLCLRECKIEEEYDLMQGLGELSNLKVLSLHFYREKRLSCKAGAFPQLQELELTYLDNVEEWIMEEGAMARLTNVNIRSCSNLMRLPQSIRSIATLKEFKTEDMSDEFCERLDKNGEDYYIIQHIPVVNIS